jgi:protein-S-isoprenylcysteine O-methyltransferase Ste14
MQNPLMAKLFPMLAALALQFSIDVTFAAKHWVMMGKLSRNFSIIVGIAFFCFQEGSVTDRFLDPSCIVFFGFEVVMLLLSILILCSFCIGPGKHNTSVPENTTQHIIA